MQNSVYWLFLNLQKGCAENLVQRAGPGHCQRAEMMYPDRVSGR
jgi:hypothetical protein